jgi:hypothetical protein
MSAVTEVAPLSPPPISVSVQILSVNLSTYKADDRSRYVFCDGLINTDREIARIAYIEVIYRRRNLHIFD